MVTETSPFIRHSKVASKKGCLWLYWYQAGGHLIDQDPQDGGYRNLRHTTECYTEQVAIATPDQAGYFDLVS